MFTDYISTRAHYSRVCSTLVPSVACQTTEVCYNFTAVLTCLPFLIVRSQTLCAQRTYPHHVQPACVLIMCYWFAYSYVPFSFSRVSLLYRYGLLTRLCLPFCLTLTRYSPSTRLKSRYSWTMTLLPFTPVCTCIPPV